MKLSYFSSLALLMVLGVSNSNAAESVATFSVKNRSQHERLQWAHVSIPFKKGQVLNKQALKSYTVDHGIVGWSPIKWHFENGKKHSIAIAALKFPVHLQPGQEKTFDVYHDQKPNTLPYQFGPNLTRYLDDAQGKHVLFALAKLKDDPKMYVSSVFDHGKALHIGPQQHSYRWRSQFHVAGTPSDSHSLSLTLYMDVMNIQDFGNFVVSVGNNTFEKPFSGGIEVEYLDFYYLTPMEFKIRHAERYGTTHAENASNGYKKVRLVQNELLADGSAHSFRGLWSVVNNPNSLNARSSQAEFADPLFGVASAQDWDRTKAGGIVGNLMRPRGTVAQMQAALESSCTSPVDVRKSGFFHYANKVPSQTGDQPAFSSNMAAMQQASIVGQSSCPIAAAMHGVMVEEYRPSYFWFENRRMTWKDTPPTCFWWSGRPHWYLGHNAGHCEEWLAHSENHNGFQMGQTPVAGEDDQHWGNPILQAAYEMSGDTWMKDMLIARQSLALWNKLGDYDWQYHRLGSERAVRLAYNATQLVLLNPDTPIAQELIPRLARHMRVRVEGGCFAGGNYCSAGIDQVFDTYGVSGLEIIFGDGRHPVFTGSTPGATCANGALCEENRGIISWWTGFSMTFAYQMLKTGIETTHSQHFINRYMDMKDFYFLPDGTNAGGRRVNDWNVTEDPFTQAWHTGWIQAVEDYGKNHPNYQFFKNTAIPNLRNSTSGDPGSGLFQKSRDKFFQ